MTTEQSTNGNEPSVASVAEGREVFARDAENEVNKGDKWIGHYFQAKLHAIYLVPENAANHGEHRGKTGECVATWCSAFGMCWATLEATTGERFVIRTCYLQKCDGTQPPAYSPDVSHGEDPIAMLKRAWEGPSNSGVAKGVIKGV